MKSEISALNHELLPIGLYVVCLLPRDAFIGLDCATQSQMQCVGWVYSTSGRVLYDVMLLNSLSSTLPANAPHSVRAGSYVSSDQQGMIKLPRSVL